jgi:hypothetical protein
MDQVWMKKNKIHPTRCWDSMTISQEACWSFSFFSGKKLKPKICVLGVKNEKNPKSNVYSG